MIKWLANRIARRRKLQERQLLSARARRGHASRIHQAFQNDVLLKEMRRADPAKAPASITLVTEVI